MYKMLVSVCVCVRGVRRFQTNWPWIIFDGWQFCAFALIEIAYMYIMYIQYIKASMSSSLFEEITPYDEAYSGKNFQNSLI